MEVALADELHEAEGREADLRGALGVMREQRRAAALGEQAAGARLQAERRQSAVEGAALREAARAAEARAATAASETAATAALLLLSVREEEEGRVMAEEGRVLAEAGEAASQQAKERLLRQLRDQVTPTLPQP